MTDKLAAARRALRTIRVRLTLWYVVLLALILAGFCTFVYTSLRQDLDAELDRLLRVQADELAMAIQTGQAADLSTDLADVPAGTIAVLTDPTTGRVLATPTVGLSRTAPSLEQLPTNVVAPATRTLVAADGSHWRVLSLPVAQDSRTTWVVSVARADRDVEVALSRLVMRMAVAVPLVLIFAIAGGVFLASRALDPIDQITRTAEAISAEDLGRRLKPSTQDEIGRFAATFDRMLDRLDHAFQQQRQFTADVSHELRTPLAMLMSQIDIALERRRSVADYQQVLRSLHEDVAQLSGLVSELLLLARAEAGQEPLSREPIDLAELAAGVVASMQPLARTRGVELTATSEQDAQVEGDETRLMQLLINLIDNAIKYTPAGGQVAVCTARAGGEALVVIRDSGEGIPPEHLPRIFERFYRVDSARSRAGGAGLGLTISHWIAQAHGGALEIASEPGRGTTVTVRLPAILSASCQVAPAAAPPDELPSVGGRRAGACDDSARVVAVSEAPGE